MISIRAALAGLLALALSGAPAAATIAIGGNGTNHVASATSIPITTTGDCPVGGVSIIAVAGTAGNPTTFSDSAGNTYSPATDATTVSGVTLAFSYAIVAIDLPNAGTITASGAPSGNLGAGAYCITGGATVSPLDKWGNTATATSVQTSPSVSTGTLSQSSEAVLLIVGTSGAPSGITCASGTQNATSGTNIGFIGCRQTVSSTASVTDTASWTSAAKNAVADIVSFNSTNPATGPLPGSLATLGAGR